MKQKPQSLQQGDVMFKPVASLPPGCKRIPSRTVALGEHTGHHHTFDEGVAVMEAPDGALFAVNETDTPVPLRHQEHKPFTAAPKQAYRIGIVREKDWFQDMVRNVRD